MYRPRSFGPSGTVARVVISPLVLCVLYCTIPKDVDAGIIPENEVRFALENIVVDTEFAFLASYAGLLSGPLDYFSQMTDTGWTGTFSGIYAGKPLNVVYVGDTTDLSSMSWAGTGNWGSETWSSSGTARYTDPPVEGILDLENMQVGLSVSGSIGAGSITAKLVKDLDDRELIGSITASALDVPVLGSALSKELSLTLSQDDWTYKSHEKFEVLFGLASRTYEINRGRLFHRDPKVVEKPPIPPPPPWDYPSDPVNPPGPGFKAGFADPGGTTYNQMQLRSIPEPSSLIVWSLLAVLTITVGCWGRRNRAA